MHKKYIVFILVITNKMADIICKQCGNTNVHELSQDLYKCDDCHEEVNWDLIAYIVDEDPDLAEKQAIVQANIDDNKTYYMNTYLKILSWFALQYWEYNPIIQVDNLSIKLDDDYYVWIFYSSEGDIMIHHYWDEEHEYDLDWWWCVEMTDMYNFIEEIWWSDNINWAELLTLKQFIEDKVDFIYELCFTW